MKDGMGKKLKNLKRKLERKNGLEERFFKKGNIKGGMKERIKRLSIIT